MDPIKLEVKGTKLDLPVFRRPIRSANECRASTIIGLSRALFGEIDGNTIKHYYSSYPHNVTSIANSHVSGDQDAASLEGRTCDTLRRESLEQQIQQLGNQTGEILELLRFRRKENEKTGRTSRDPRVKKPAAPHPKLRTPSRRKKSALMKRDGFI